MRAAFIRFQRGCVMYGALFLAFLATHAVYGQANRSDLQTFPIERKATPEYEFSAEDDQLLDAIQRGCFNYLWNESGWPSGMAQDRRTNLLASTAGVGFQLSAIPIGVERGWITRDEGEARAVRILKNLLETPNNHHDGMSLHFVEANSGKLDPTAGNNEASTVDHSLLLAGAMPAAVYFQGEVAELVDRLEARSNWRSYTATPEGFLSMAWLPSDNRTMGGPGRYTPARWHLASDEEHLIYFLAAGSSNPEFAVDPAVYYRLERTVKQHDEMDPYVVSQNGLLFTYFFSQLWIEYRGLEADDPSQFGAAGPRVDWFENSRRAILTHRRRCQEAADRFVSFGENRWGLSPCMGYGDRGRLDYLVPEVMPNLSNRDSWLGANVTPYAAGCAIMFAPAESMAALREFRELKDRDGDSLTWSPPELGGYGLCDSFNLDLMLAANDYVAIDVGPMILAIENARTGRVWRLFKEHAIAKRASGRLKFVERESL